MSSTQSPKRRKLPYPTEWSDLASRAYAELLAVEPHQQPPTNVVTHDTTVMVDLTTHCRLYRGNLEYNNAGKVMSSIGPYHREDFLTQLQVTADAAGSLADSGAPKGPRDESYRQVGTSIRHANHTLLTDNYIPPTNLVGVSRPYPNAVTFEVYPLRPTFATLVFRHHRWNDATAATRQTLQQTMTSHHSRHTCDAICKHISKELIFILRHCRGAPRKQLPRDAGGRVLLSSVAANGHTMISQPFLDPARIAAAMTMSFLDIVPGFFHVTPINRMRSIMKQGLLPGTVQERNGRMDIHASVFGPSDPRGEQTRNRIAECLSFEAQCAVVFIEAAGVIDTGRVNLGDGVRLWSQAIPIQKITCIVAVSRACGEHAANVSGNLKFDFLFDNQFATIEGRRKVRSAQLLNLDLVQPSTITRERLRELGFTLTLRTPRSL